MISTACQSRACLGPDQLSVGHLVTPKLTEYKLRSQHTLWEFEIDNDNMCGSPRTGNLIFGGKVGTVMLTSSGTGAVYVSGVTQAVTANLGGLGTAVIDAASGAVQPVTAACFLNK